MPRNPSIIATPSKPPNPTLQHTTYLAPSFPVHTPSQEWASSNTIPSKSGLLETRWSSSHGSHHYKTHQVAYIEVTLHWSNNNARINQWPSHIYNSTLSLHHSLTHTFISNTVSSRKLDELTHRLLQHPQNHLTQPSTDTKSENK
jgi:hypothetical protein